MSRLRGPDPEHESKLKEGPEAWNRWRFENPDVRPSLAAIDLPNANFEGINLKRADLRQADLRLANLVDAKLGWANLRGASLWGATLQGSDLEHANLSEANLASAWLGRARLDDAKLRSANLEAANLVNSRIGNASLQGACLAHADLLYAYLGFTDLSQATLDHANLGGADLTHATLDRASLQGTKLQDTTLHGVDLTSARGLDQIEHGGPSPISSQTLALCEGKLPTGFLKGCGLSDWEVLSATLHNPRLRPDEVIDVSYEISNLRAASPIVPLSVFISYTRTDQVFIQRLETQFDLDGIRSWRDVHDLVAGPLEPQVDRAIGLQRATLLVLSEQSVESDWVEWEAAKAREAEKRRKKSSGLQQYLLCPVALDGSWKDCDWPERLRCQIEKYNVLDFSDWRDSSKFELQYEKLKKGLGIYYRQERQGSS